MAELRARAVAACFAAGVCGTTCAADHEVVIEGMQFVPQRLEVHAGDRVTWVNRDLVPHTATATGRFDSKALAPGRSWRWKVSGKGTQDYLCSLHPTMKGTLVVK